MFLYFERNLREILARPGEPLVYAVGTAVRATFGNDGNLIGLVFGSEEFEREQERSHGSTFGDSCGKFHGVPFHVCDCRYLHDPTVHHGEFVYEESKRRMMRALPPLRFLTGRGGGKSFAASRMRWNPVTEQVEIEPIEERRYYADPFADPERNRQGGEAIMERARREYEAHAVEGRHPTWITYPEWNNAEPDKPKRPPSKLHPLVQLDEELRRLGEASDPLIEPGHP